MKEMSGDFSASNLAATQTFPLAVKFLKDRKDFQPRPAAFGALGKRVSICQGSDHGKGLWLDRGTYREDLICVPAMIAFGFSGAADPTESLTGLFLRSGLCPGSRGCSPGQWRPSPPGKPGVRRPGVGRTLEKLLLNRYRRTYGNARAPNDARLIMALVYIEKRRIDGNFGGKVECTEYLLAPFQTRSPRVVIPVWVIDLFHDKMMKWWLSIPGQPPGRVGSTPEGIRQEDPAPAIRSLLPEFQPEFPRPTRSSASRLGSISQG